MIVPAYGSEQGRLADGALRRAFLRVAGSYDLGARARYAVVEPELARLPVPRRVLDAGSGHGELCFAMARRWPSAEILGVDSDAARIARAERVRVLAFPSGRIAFANVALPHAFASPFDAVVSIDVLEHIDDDAGFLRSLYDATAENGTLILHTPAAQQRRFLAAFAEQHDHVRDGYAREGLERLLRDAGYRDVRVRPTFGTLGAIAWEGFALARAGNRLAAATLPVWYALAALDTRRVPPSGNGLLATARR